MRSVISVVSGSTSASRYASLHTQTAWSAHGSTASRSSTTPVLPPTGQLLPLAIPTQATFHLKWASIETLCPSP